MDTNRRETITRNLGRRGERNARRSVADTIVGRRQLSVATICLLYLRQDNLRMTTEIGLGSSSFTAAGWDIKNETIFANATMSPVTAPIYEPISPDPRSVSTALKCSSGAYFRRSKAKSCAQLRARKREWSSSEWLRADTPSRNPHQTTTPRPLRRRCRTVQANSCRAQKPLEAACVGPLPKHLHGVSGS